MTKPKDLVMKTCLHPVLGKVAVLRVMPKSRTMVEVQEIDKGEGWDKEKKKFTGVKTATGWTRSQNYDYGHVDEVHYKDLTVIEEEED